MPGIAKQCPVCQDARSFVFSCLHNGKTHQVADSCPLCYAHSVFDPDFFHQTQDQDEDMQRVVAVDAIRPRLLNNLRNVYFSTVVATQSLPGLRAHIHQQTVRDAHENEFCQTVKQLLDFGVTTGYLRNALNDDPSVSPDYKMIYKEWVMVALLRAGHRMEMNSILRANAH